MKKVLTFGVTTILIAMFLGMTVFAAEYTVTETSATLYTNQEAVVYLDADINMASTCVLPSGMPIVVTGVTSNGFWQVNIDNTTFYMIGNVLEATVSTAEQGNTEGTTEYTLSEEDRWMYVLSTVSELRDSLKNPYSLILDCCFGGGFTYENKLWYVVNVGYYATNSFGGYINGHYTAAFNLSEGTVVFGTGAIAKEKEFREATNVYYQLSKQEEYYLNYVTSYDLKSIKDSLGF